jgi:hypothetical protein
MDELLRVGLRGQRLRAQRSGHRHADHEAHAVGDVLGRAGQADVGHRASSARGRCHQSAAAGRRPRRGATATGAAPGPAARHHQRQRKTRQAQAGPGTHAPHQRHGQAQVGGVHDHHHDQGVAGTQVGAHHAGHGSVPGVQQHGRGQPPQQRQRQRQHLGRRVEQAQQRQRRQRAARATAPPTQVLAPSAARATRRPVAPARAQALRDDHAHTGADHAEQNAKSTSAPAADDARDALARAAGVRPAQRAVAGVEEQVGQLARPMIGTLLGVAGRRPVQNCACAASPAPGNSCSTRRTIASQRTRFRSRS